MTTSTITVTDAAAARIKHLLSEQGEGKLGLRVGVREAGCSGMAYTIDFAESAKAGDQVVDDKGVTVVIDAEAAVDVEAPRALDKAIDLAPAELKRLRVSRLVDVPGSLTFVVAWHAPLVLY